MDLRDSTIAVTGATGFLGRYIVDALLRRGAHVVGVVRNPDRVPGLAARGVELRRADLGEPDRLLAGFHGVDAVVSNAALFSLRNASWKDHLNANINGTRNVVEAMAAAGVARVVQISSVAVYRGRKQPCVSEDHPQHSADSRRLPWTIYPISKALSEQLAWRIARERGLQLTALRPGAIYGAFDPNFTTIFRRLVTNGVIPLSFVPALGKISLVYGGDVAEAVALALERPVSIGKAYNVTGDDRRLREFGRAWFDAGGRRHRLALPLPVPMNDRFDHSRAERELGWSNRPFVDALRETFALEAISSPGGT